jgi:hypothetical protein
MAYERAWQFDYNRSFTPASTLQLTKWQLWLIKSLLLGHVGGFTQGLWALIGSSNGTTAALDSIDRWVGIGDQTTTFDATTEANIPRTAVSGTSSPCGWIVLLSPALAGHGQRYYLTISFSTLSGTVQDYFANWRWSKVAPTLAATPTWPPVISDYWSVAAGNQQIPVQMNNNTFGTILHRMNTSLTPTGDFISYLVRQNATVSEWCAMTIAPEGYRALDQYAVFTATGYISGATPTLGGVFGLSGTSPPMETAAHSYDTSISGSTNRMVIVSDTYGGSIPIIDGVDGSLMDFPSWVIAANATVLWMRGRLPDIGLSVLNQSTNTMPPSGQAIRDGSNNLIYITMGGWILPAATLPDLS